METLTPMDLALISSASAYLATALVAKDGPKDMFLRIRKLLDSRWPKHPLNCFTCALYWISIVVWAVYTRGNQDVKNTVAVLSVMGLANAIRGLSAEY